MVQVELIINNTSIPLSGELSIPLNFQISDIQKPETRQGNYSKTITIPSSKETDQLFGYIFDLNMSIDSSGSTNFTPDFNPNLKATAVVKNDGIVVFEGIAQLLAVNVKDRRDITYEICLFSKLRNLFDEIGDKELKDLDFSEFDHEYNYTNITNSWATSIKQNGSDVAFSYGNGYVYPLIDYGFSTDLTTFAVNQLYPAIYVKEYIDKIFTDAGFVYDSSFFDSAFFKKLIIPFSSAFLRLSSAQILDRKFRARRSSTYNLNILPAGTYDVLEFNDDSTAPNFDTSNQYDTATGVFTVGTGLNASHTFITQLRIGYTLTPDEAGISLKQNYNAFVGARITNVTTGAVIGVGAVNTFHPNFFYTSYTSTNPAPDNTDFPSSGYNPANYLTVVASSVNLAAGDQVRVDLFTSSTATSALFVDSSGTTHSGSIQWHIYSDSYFRNNIDNSVLQEGNTVVMSNALPQKVKQKDFLLSIIKMFNLYLEQDENVTNKFKIEPRNDYYTTEVLDWSDKLDQDSDLVINPMQLLDAKKYSFKYKEDSDYFNTTYKNSWNEVYGQRDIEINNDFVKGVKTIDVIFSPTPSVGNAASDRIIPRIVKIDDAGVTSSHEGNIRILHYSGLKSCNANWYITHSGLTSGHITYPFTGMVDDAFDPTLDLGWGVPAEIYWEAIFDDITYTNNNLVNKYWSEMLLEIIHPDSRVVTGYFNLRPYDIYNIDFRKIYYFENEYFRLNKVIDYDPVNSNLTKCEFLKIIRGTEFTGTTEVVNDSYEVSFGTSSLFTTWLVYGGSERQPTIQSPLMKNSNVVRRMDGSGEVFGSGNRIGSNVQGYFIVGDLNVVGDNSRNVSILNSSGVVATGSNITVMNSYNMTVTGDKVMVVDGKYVFGGDAVKEVTQHENLSDSYKYYLLDATSGNKTFDLLTAKGREGEEFVFKKVDGSGNRFRIRANDGETIDGSIFIDIITQNDCITIFSDGTNWQIKSRA